MSRSKASASSSPIFKIQDEDRFYLNDDFIEQYKNREPKWGPVGNIAYVRTYARELRGEELVQFLTRDMKMARKEARATARQIKSKREEFWQTARRVVEFAWTVFQRQARMSHHAWNSAEAQEKAQEMFRRLWDFKWLPPGRGMQFAGTPVVEIKGGAVLNNCGFLSTQYWNDTTDRARYSEVFGRFMDFLMLGVGMGSDVRGAKAFVVQAPKPFDGDVHIVEDSREGWVHALRMKLDSYFIGRCEVEFEFSNIRDAGKLLKTLGGTASGSAPLERLLARIDEILKPLINHPITQSAITDIFNEIGVCVVSGNIRRSAEIMIGENGDHEFAALKDPSDIVKWSEEREAIENSLPEIVRIKRRITSLRKKQVGLSAANAMFIYCQDKIDRAQARIQKIAQQNPEWVRLTANIMNHPLNTHRWACVTGDTLVDTTEGMLPISRLVGRSDVVVRLNGETHSALGIKLTGNEPTFRVITKGGPSVRATSNHQFMTSRGWVRTDQLTEGDCLLASSKKVPIDQTATDYKRGYLMGMLIGDGTFTKTTTTKTPIARIQTYTRDLGNASLRAYIEGIFDFETRRDFRGFSGPHGNGDSQYHFLSAKKFTDFAASYGVTKGSKTITDLIEQSASLELQAGVLSGFFDADGWVLSDRRTLAVDQADLKILERAQRMLLRLGIASRINKVRNADERVFPGSTKRSCKPVWRLTICGYAHASTFVSVCGIHHSEKLSKWRAIEPPQSTKKSHAYVVDSVDPTGVSEDVYDICVPGPCAFSANGLYVHNSNNTQLFDVEDDFTEVAKQIATNGEPGVAFLQNIQNYGRTNDISRKETLVCGFNPCAEQQLEDGELCCLGELNPNAHENLEDFLATIKYAYMYCKAVTLVPTHDQATNKIMTKNRRIGLSMMGIWKMYERLGMQECIRWWDWGYEEVRKWDKTYSEWLGVNESIKVTSVKPGGTIPLLVGEEGGMKIPTAKYYFRTIRMDHSSPLAKACKDAGYRVEKDRNSPRTVVVYFPVFDESTKRTAEDVSMWEQMGLLAELQAHWSDNMVSNTITFQPLEASEIAQAIAMFAHRIKAVSFLPLMTHGYAQAPYIPIEQWEYELAAVKIGSLDLTKGGHEVDEKYCTGDVCMRA